MKSKVELKRSVERYLNVQKELKAELERMRKEQERVTSVKK